MEESELFNFTDIECFETRTKRQTCQNCKRPLSACWCSFLPKESLKVKTRIFILQHPFEESRNLKTAPMLKLGLEEDKCIIYRDTRFSKAKYPLLHDTIENEKTLLVYPSPNAVDLQDLFIKNSTETKNKNYNVILLDGTWPQALAIYSKNKFLDGCQAVMLSSSETLRPFYPEEFASEEIKSRYVIRTQPAENTFSTVETAAIVISVLEQRNDVIGVFIKPLDALCQFQLDHGAVEHQSKQHLIEEGRYSKKISNQTWNRVYKLTKPSDSDTC